MSDAGASIASVIDESSLLAADTAKVWQRVSTVDGINAELHPFRMHLPRRLDVLADLAGNRQTRGVLISLLGWIPMDWHGLGIESLQPGQGFHERSTSLWMRSWGHVRRIEQAEKNCRLTDHVEFVPRVGLLAPLLLPDYRRVFHRRHAELRRQFGSAAGSTP
jgi:ligand-binding SRPBCC domain-containing protein